MGKIKTFPIKWVLTKISRTRQVMLGFCGKTGHAIKLQRPMSMTTMVLQDFDVDDKEGCEQGRYCFYFACPLNKTSPETYYKDQAKNTKGKANSLLGEVTASQHGFEVKEGGYLMLKDKRGRTKPYIELRRVRK